jgi:hypothetical protein
VGSVLDKKENLKSQTSDLDDICTQLGASMKKLLHLLALHCGLEKSTAYVGAKLQNYICT